MNTADKIILIYYVDIRGLSKSSTISIVEQFKKEAPKGEDVIVQIIPYKGETKVDCINPKLISADEYAKVKEVLDRNQQIVDKLVIDTLPPKQYDYDFGDEDESKSAKKIAYQEYVNENVVWGEPTPTPLQRVVVNSRYGTLSGDTSTQSLDMDQPINEVPYETATNNIFTGTNNVYTGTNIGTSFFMDSLPNVPVEHTHGENVVVTSTPSGEVYWSDRFAEETGGRPQTETPTEQPTESTGEVTINGESTSPIRVRFYGRYGDNENNIEW